MSQFPIFNSYLDLSALYWQKIIKKDDSLKVVEGKPKPFEHYKIEKVLDRVEQILNPDCAAQFGEWDEKGRYN